MRFWHYGTDLLRAAFVCVSSLRRHCRAGHGNMENNSTSSKELFDMSTSSSMEGGEDIAETSQRSTNSPKVSKQLVGKVLRSAVRRLDSEPSLKSDFGVTESVYKQRFKKPKRPRSKKSTFKRQSPRRANTDIRGTLRPSTYFHVPAKKSSRRRPKNPNIQKTGAKRTSWRQ